MSERTCGTCRWFEVLKQGEGCCHRQPPSGNDGFPLLGEYGWCGEWTAKCEHAIPPAPVSRPPETRAATPPTSRDAEPYGWACRTAHGTTMFTSKEYAQKYAKEWLSHGVHVMANVFPLYLHPPKESR